ncbi:MAG TPA: hypothetical protein VJ742_12010 [Nitrososphaera sp.]|nr:hypothetical protein [Nitrososphaera sp.]
MAEIESNGKLGFLLDEELTDKLHVIAMYMEVTPYEMIRDSIERLYDAYLKIGLGDNSVR